MNVTMIIECPNCGTKYKVIQEAIRPRGRTVHCTTCSNKWHVDPVTAESEDRLDRFKPDPIEQPAPEAEEEESDAFHRQRAKAAEDEVEAEEPLAHEVEAEHAEPETEPEAAAELDESFMVLRSPISSEHEEGRAGRGLSVALLAASLALLTGGIVASRSRIEPLWPASARLYQAVGLENGAVRGQGLELKEAHAYLTKGNQGAMLNIEAKVVNPLKTSVHVPILDAWLMSDNGPAKHWTVKPDTDHLDSGGNTRVKANVDGANTENGKILLTFSTDNGVGSK